MVLFAALFFSPPGMVWSFLIFLPILIRLLFELYWFWDRKRYVFDNRNGSAWAIVTGAGNGLGLEYAKLLAEKGFNQLLLSLYENELLDAKKTILASLEEKELPKVRIETLEVDFSKTETCYLTIETFLKSYLKDVSILVNNVGTDAQHCDYFDIGNCERRNRLIIDVNLYSCTRMVELVLPEMKANKNGLIISISSGAARTVSPLLATYASTKAYIKTLMSALAVENRKYGITFVTFCPYWISTNLTNNAPTNFFTPKPGVYAKDSLSKIHYQDSLETIGYWPHQVLFGITKFFGLLGGRRLEELYSHWVMIQIRNFRKTLLVDNKNK